jgi:hypothetical protein
MISQILSKKSMDLKKIPKQIKAAMNKIMVSMMIGFVWQGGPKECLIVMKNGRSAETHSRLIF